jgi:hypothetical protein
MGLTPALSGRRPVANGRFPPFATFALMRERDRRFHGLASDSARSSRSKRMLFSNSNRRDVSCSRARSGGTGFLTAIYAAGASARDRAFLRETAVAPLAAVFQREYLRARSRAAPARHIAARP